MGVTRINGEARRVGRYTVRTYSCAEHLVRLGFNIDPGWAPPEPRRHRVTIADIQAAVAERFDVPLREMKSDRRAREVVRPRQVAIYLSKMLTPRSLPEIGRHFGGRDHTTVIHAIAQIEKLSAGDDELRDHIDALTDFLTEGKPKPDFSQVPDRVEASPAAEAPPAGASWCIQCERNVCAAEAERCSSRWCKAKPTREGFAHSEGAL